MNVSEELSEDLLNGAIEDIERAMQNCDECSAETVENIRDACIEHKKMYGTINP